MDREIFRVHHVTAIASDPNRNIAFYTEILGLKLVKLTVNFDDPGSYHFYHGDEVGHPGTLLTFFVWPDAPRGRKGPGQVTVVKFGIPFGSMSFWADRLRHHHVMFEEFTTAFKEETLKFNDPDGLQLELIKVDESRAIDNEYGPIPNEQAIIGIHGVTLLEPALEATDSLLTGILGFQRLDQKVTRTRYSIGHTFVDLIHTPDEPRGFVSVGTVHHVAWRIADQEQQRNWREQITEVGLNVTPNKRFSVHLLLTPGAVAFRHPMIGI
jgi:glyoxalase family protein